MVYSILVSVDYESKEIIAFIYILRPGMSASYPQRKKCHNDNVNNYYTLTDTTNFHNYDYYNTNSSLKHAQSCLPLELNTFRH